MGELAGQEVSVELMEVDEDNGITRSVPRAVILAHNFVRIIGIVLSRKLFIQTSYPASACLFKNLCWF